MNESIVENEQQNGYNRIIQMKQQLLIQEGGYVSPDNHLWEEFLISVVLKKPVLLKRSIRFWKNKIGSISFKLFQSANAKCKLFRRSRCGITSWL